MIHARVTNKTGVILKTSGKYCEDNILVTPLTQIKNTNVTRNGSITIAADNGFCGMTEVVVNVNIPLHDNFNNAEGVEF